MTGRALPRDSLSGRAGFIAWPLPAAAGAVVGISLAKLFASLSGASLTSSLALLACGILISYALLGTSLANLRQPGGRPPLRPPFGRRWRSPPMLLLATITALLAGGRYLAWQGRANPATAYLGVEREWRGQFDGVVFRADEPVKASFKLVAPVEAPVGELVLAASAEEAPGKRNPGGFDYAAYLRRRGIDGQLFVEEVLRSQPRPGALQLLERGVRAGLEPEHAALVSALTLGLKDDLGEDLQEAFARAGMAHLLALSGLHFGVLLGAVALALRRFGELRNYLLLVLIVGFVMLVGPAPSVVRAALMAGAYLLARILGVGRLEPLAVLSLAATMALVLQPQMLFDLSFQLSYLALLGLIAFTGQLTAVGLAMVGAGHGSPLNAVAAGARASEARGWCVRVAPARLRGRAARFVTTGIAASVAAQLPSLSLVAGSFGLVPLFSPLTNLVAIPLSTLLVPLGFAAGLLGLISERLAWLVNRPTSVIAGLVTELARLADSLPAIYWSEIGWLGHLCWAVAVTALALFLRRRLLVRQLLLVVIAAGGSAAGAGAVQPPPDVWFLDVGQGDATLIRLPGRYEVLIDAGGSPFSDDDVGERVVLPALRALGVDELELVIATHPDADHVEGLFTVLERMPVATLVTSPPAPGNALDDDLRALATSHGVAIHVARRGETLVIGRTGETVLEVLHPAAGGGGGSANEESVVVLLRHRGAAAVLLLADVGTVTETDLALGRVAVLRVGHHGSRFSTSPALLRATAPRLAVISVGKNNYGHPHASVLERLAAAGVPVTSTAEQGAIRFDLSKAVQAVGPGRE